jgi:hypothetical protein
VTLYADLIRRHERSTRNAGRSTTIEGRIYHLSRAESLRSKADSLSLSEGMSRTKGRHAKAKGAAE